MTMITSGCGCAAGACACSGSCCDGNDVLVPAAIANPPGQAALRHRIGTHASFFESMLAHLVAPPEQAARCEGEAPDADDPITSWPLRELTSRELDDPTIALLDAWAVVGDILTFYQERIANEGYLRTATEQRSVEELARLVGYRPRPGVAASIDLAFSLERNVVTTIPAGTRAQSLPAPGKLPQTFETSRPLLANARWNAMRPLQSRFLRPRTSGNRLIVYLAGTATSLSINDVVYVPPPTPLEEPGPNDPPLPIQLANKRLYRVDHIEILADISTTRVRLRLYNNDPIADENKVDDPEFFGAIAELDVEKAVASFGGSSNARYWSERDVLDLVDEDRVRRDSFRLAIEAVGAERESKTKCYVFRASSPLFGHNAAAGRYTGETVEAWDKPLAPYDEQPKRLFLDAVNPRVQPGGFVVIDRATPISAPAEDDDELEPPSPSSLSAAINNTENLTIGDNELVELDADDRDFLLDLLDSDSQVDIYWLLRFISGMREFGEAKQDDDEAAALVAAIGVCHSLAKLLADHDEDLAAELDATADTLATTPKLEEIIAKLDAGEPKPKPNDLTPDDVGLYSIKTVSTHSRDAYGIAKQTLDLVLHDNWFAWPDDLATAFLDPLRSVVTFNESEELRVARTLLDALDGEIIELDGLVFDLAPGRTLILEGEDADAPGAIRTERVTIAAITHDLVDVSTLVTLAAPLEYTYLRAKTIIYGNVAAATQGESRREVLGSGDASKPSQRFVLRHQPLTHVPAATASGAASTLTVRVQGFAWPEVEHRVGLGPRARNVVTQRDEQGRTLVSGGDGWQGARFPTGIENIVAEYRSGQGADGNIAPHKATNLATRPFGVQKVTNPLAASGGADPDDIESTRLRAPLAVEALDRLLSVDDYRSFALNFAGIAKAVATRVGSGDVFGRWRIRAVVAGLVAEPLDPASELMLRLARAMRLHGDPALELELVPAKLQRLSITAKLAIAPGYAFVDVEPLVRAQLLDALGYARQDIGQAIPPSRIAALIQAVPGVAFVDLDELGTSDTVYDLDPLVFDPDPAKEVEEGEAEDPPPKTDATDTMIVVADDTILYLDPTQTDTLALEELTP